AGLLGLGPRLLVCLFLRLLVSRLLLRCRRLRSGRWAATREKSGGGDNRSNCRLQKETAWDGSGPLSQIIDHDWPSSTSRAFAGSPYLKAGYWSNGGLRSSAAIRFSRFSPNRISTYGSELGGRALTLGSDSDGFLSKQSRYEFVPLFHAGAFLRHVGPSIIAL